MIANKPIPAILTQWSKTIIEAANKGNSNVDLNVSSDTIAEIDVSDFKHLSANSVHHESHHNPSPHENLFPDSVRNKMLTHYNCIVICSFKEFFQHIDMNNLAEVLKAVRELNFVLANRAPELALYYNMELEARKLLQKKFPTLSELTSIGIQLKMHSTVPEEDTTLEVTNTTGTVDSCHQYWGTTNIPKVQKLVFTPIEIMVTHIITLIANIIHPILLGIPLPQVIIQLM